MEGRRVFYVIAAITYRMQREEATDGRAEDRKERRREREKEKNVRNEKGGGKEGL